MKQIRIENTLKLMQENDLDGLIYATSANFQYLLNCNHYHWQRSSMNNIFGYSNYRNLPEAFLYLRNTGELHVFVVPTLKETFQTYSNLHVTYLDQFEDALAPYLKGSKIGIGFACFDFLKELVLEINPNLNIIDSEALLNDLRAIKDLDEINSLKEIALFTDEAITHLISQLKPGLKQYEVENMVINYGLEHNIADLSFTPTCGFKPQNSQLALDALTFDRNTGLAENTAIAFDIGYLNKGYCSDWGRSIYYGTAPSLVSDGYNALQAGQINLVEKIVPNQTNVNELYDLVLEKVTELGFKDYLRFQDSKSLGHQIGIDTHEHPMLNKDVNYILKPGMVFCSEPKMFFKNEAYLRVEDMILVTENGAEFLTHFDRKLFNIN